MDIFINYLIKNKEWIFSGLGIFVIGGIISCLLYTSPSPRD